MVCGQALKWYGTMKYAIRLTWKDSRIMKTMRSALENGTDEFPPAVFSDLAWKDARRRCHLDKDDIIIAKKLGISPSSLVEHIPKRGMTWKVPVKDWLYTMKEEAREENERMEVRVV